MDFMISCTSDQLEGCMIYSFSDNTVSSYKAAPYNYDINVECLDYNQNFEQLSNFTSYNALIRCKGLNFELAEIYPDDIDISDLHYFIDALKSFGVSEKEAGAVSEIDLEPFLASQFYLQFNEKAGHDLKQLPDFLASEFDLREKGQGFLYDAVHEFLAAYPELLTA